MSYCHCKALGTDVPFLASHRWRVAECECEHASSPSHGDLVTVTGLSPWNHGLPKHFTFSLISLSILTISFTNISYSMSFLKGIYILMLCCLIYESLYLLYLLCMLHVLSLSSASLSDNLPVVQLLCCVQLFATAWTIAHQVLLSMGFPARILEWAVLFFSRGSS